MKRAKRKEALRGYKGDQLCNEISNLGQSILKAVFHVHNSGIRQPDLIGDIIAPETIKKAASAKFATGVVHIIEKPCGEQLLMDIMGTAKVFCG